MNAYSSFILHHSSFTMPFVIRQFHHEQTLGEKLHTLRKDARLTLSELAEKTKIQKSYLKAFEANAFQALPDPIYTRNYLKTIVQTLGADEAYYLDQFEQERGTCDTIKNLQLPRQRARATTFFVTSRLAHMSVFLILIGLLSSYIGFQVKSIITPPELAVLAPIDGILTTDATILVKGKTEKGAVVSINGVNVLLAQDGSFEQEVALERGLNVLRVEGSKRYSHLAQKYIRVIFDHNREISLRKGVDKTP